MKILLVGDIVGSPGRRAFAWVVARMRQSGAVDFVLANAENAAGGKGITVKIANELYDAGADVLTLGDHAWDQKDIYAFLDREPRVVRPANFAPGCPGRGITTVESPAGRVTALNLVGRVFMRPMDCPFRKADELLAGSRDLASTILVDMHAEATSEKIVMGRYLDGRVSAVVGTHTHVQTSDDTILPHGTAYLTDLGMTGPKDSAIGREFDAVLQTFLTGMPSRFKVATEGVVLEGAMLTTDGKTGKARRFKRIREPVGD